MFIHTIGWRSWSSKVSWYIQIFIWKLKLVLKDRMICQHEHMTTHRQCLLTFGSVHVRHGEAAHKHYKQEFSMHFFWVHLCMVAAAISSTKWGSIFVKIAYYVFTLDLTRMLRVWHWHHVNRYSCTTVWRSPYRRVWATTQMWQPTIWSENKYSNREAIKFHTPMLHVCTGRCALPTSSTHLY